MSEEQTWITFDADVWTDADSDDADEVLSMLEAIQSSTVHTGAVVTAGGRIPTLGVRFSLIADDPGFALEAGAGIVLAALEKAGVEHQGFARLQLIDERLDELELEEPADTIVGVAEVAELLGVQKQRVPQLRVTQGFPAPIAELASGPVWKGSSLRRFAETWERKPGRPRRKVGV